MEARRTRPGAGAVSLLQVVALAGCKSSYAHSLAAAPLLGSMCPCLCARGPMDLAEMSTEQSGFRVPAAHAVAGGVYALTALALRPEIRELRRH